MSKASLADIRSAIDSSGYVLELRLAPKIERAGFWVRSDHQFRDQDTGKSREIDLYAHSRSDISSRETKVGKITYILADTLDVHLVVECKSTTNPLVFFSRENKVPMYGRLLLGGLPTLMWKFDKQSEEVVGELFEYHLRLPQFHSYWQPNHLATKFGRLISKKVAAGAVEWELDHGLIYSAVEKLSKATLSIHGGRLREARDPEPEHTDQFRLHMTYPVLVVSGDIYECRVSERRYSLKKVSGIHLDWSLDSEKVKGNVRICVVTEKSFSSFMKTVVADKLNTERFLKRKLDRLRQAVSYEKTDPMLRKHHNDFD